MIDPYAHPETGALINKLGITDPIELEEVEGLLVSVRDSKLAAAPLPGLFDFDHLCEIHRYLFADVYSWAGSVRTVAIHKGKFPFCMPEFIASYASDIFARAPTSSQLRELNSQQVSAALADFLADVNALHPFREGNGRSQRALLRHLAGSSGWNLDWGGLDRRLNAQASEAAMSGDSQPLKDLILPLLERHRNK